MVLGILLSIAGWFSIQRRADAIDDASAAAAQLIRVQDVRVRIVEADSLASRAYLAGGQEDPDQRLAYDDRVAAAASGLVEAASAATGDDVELLERASIGLGTYIGLVEQARANNRQGFPVGAAYQRQARTVGEGVVADLRELEAGARERVDDSIATAHRAGWPVGTAAVLALAAIALGGVWLAVRWRRLINVPLAGAGLIALLVLTMGLGANASAMREADDVVEGSLSAADVLAQARAAAFDARSNEALTLVYRGSGAAFEAQWAESSSIVDTALATSCGAYAQGCGAIDAYAEYARGYRVVRSLDAAGDWEGAVDLSTAGEGMADVDPVLAFDSFADVSATAIDDRTDAAIAGFAGATDGLDVVAVAIVVAGALIALLAALGYGQRLREYR